MARRPVVLDSEEREAGEKGYCSSLLLCYLFFPSPVFCSFSLSSLTSSNLSLSLSLVLLAVAPIAFSGSGEEETTVVPRG